MSAPTNHWKLGLFVVISMLVGLFAAVYFGAQALRKETVLYRSYFDEAVTGLEIGSPVTFRGVTLGNVSAIDVARDRRHVEISYELGLSELARLGLAIPDEDGESTKIKVPPDLRVQLASNGITGSKYLQLDFFKVETHPLPELPFPTAENYIPATPSTMKSIEAAVMRAADAIPDMSRDMAIILGQVNGLLGEIRQEKLPEKTAATMDAATRAFASLDTTLRQINVKELSQEARAALAKLNTTLAKTDSVLAEMEGQKGLMVSLTRASDRIGDVAENASGLGPELTKTLGEFREAAQAIHELIFTLEQDPDMLIKGRVEVSE